jgi:hypothetical protein
VIHQSIAGKFCLVAIVALVCQFIGPTLIAHTVAQQAVTNGDIKLEVSCSTFDAQTADVHITCEVLISNRSAVPMETTFGQFYVLDGGGAYFPPSRAALEAIGREDEVLRWPGQLEAGAEVSGWAGFKVPRTAPGPLQFLYLISILESLPGPKLGSVPANEFYVELDVAPWHVESLSGPQATIHALETQVAFLETQTAPTATATPVPPTATLAAEQLTIVALETKVGNLSATLTPQVNDSSSAEDVVPSVTALPSSTPRLGKLEPQGESEVDGPTATEVASPTQTATFTPSPTATVPSAPTSTRVPSATPKPTKTPKPRPTATPNEEEDIAETEA